MFIGNALCHEFVRKTGCSTGIVFPPEGAAEPRIEERGLCDLHLRTERSKFDSTMMFSDTDSSNANTSVLNVGTKSNHPEVNEELAQASRDISLGQTLEGQPLSSPSRTTFKKRSTICPKHPRHETKMTSVRELRETRSKSLQDQARECQLNALNSIGDHWRPSKSPTMSDEHRTAREVYHRGKMKLDGGDTGQMMRKAMLTPEGKWFTYPRAACDYQKRPVSRRVCESGHCEAGAEQKRNVAVKR